MGSFYVYEHTRRDTGLPFYVGKGKGRRAWHGEKHRNAPWRDICRDAGGYDVKIVADHMDEEFALFCEVELIDKYTRLGVSLANLTKGGDGAALIGEAAERHREAVKTAHQDPEAKAKHRAAVKAAHAKPETKALMRSIAADRMKDDKALAALRSGLVSSWQDPDRRARRVEAIRASSAKKSADMAEHKKPLVCVETGQIFDSIKDAARWLILNGHSSACAGTIGQACSGRRKSAYGYTWRRA